MESDRKTNIIFYEYASHTCDLALSVLCSVSGNMIGFDILIEGISYDYMPNLSELDVENLIYRMIENGKFKTSEHLSDRESIYNFFESRCLEFKKFELDNKIRLNKINTIING